MKIRLSLHLTAHGNYSVKQPLIMLKYFVLQTLFHEVQSIVGAGWGWFLRGSGSRVAWLHFLRKD